MSCSGGSGGGAAAEAAAARTQVTPGRSCVVFCSCFSAAAPLSSSALSASIMTALRALPSVSMVDPMRAASTGSRGW